MSGKFKKRDVERKGAEKEREKDEILVNRNAEDLAYPEKHTGEYEAESSPEESEESK